MWGRGLEVWLWGLWKEVREEELGVGCGSWELGVMGEVKEGKGRVRGMRMGLLDLDRWVDE